MIAVTAASVVAESRPWRPWPSRPWAQRQPRSSARLRYGSAGSTTPKLRADFNQPVDFSGDNVPVERTDAADLGEGAPGADGSRRWRGRRGRRRGRGPGQRDESPQLTEAGSQAELRRRKSSRRSAVTTTPSTSTAQPLPAPLRTRPLPSPRPIRHPTRPRRALAAATVEIAVIAEIATTAAVGGR